MRVFGCRCSRSASEKVEVGSQIGLLYMRRIQADVTTVHMRRGRLPRRPPPLQFRFLHVQLQTAPRYVQRDRVSAFH